MEWYFHSIPHARLLLPQEHAAEVATLQREFAEKNGTDKDLLSLIEGHSRPILHALIENEYALFGLVDRVFQTNEAHIFKKGLQLVYSLLKFVFLSPSPKPSLSSKPPLLI